MSEWQEEWRKANRANWDERVPIHASGEFYDVASFKAGRERLQPFEITEVGGVSGKDLLHLQCHFGMDTLSWARRGASVAEPPNVGDPPSTYSGEYGRRPGPTANRRYRLAALLRAGGRIRRRCRRARRLRFQAGGSGSDRAVRRRSTACTRTGAATGPLA
jgi:hypothetical protein